MLNSMFPYRVYIDITYSQLSARRAWYVFDSTGYHSCYLLALIPHIPSEMLRSDMKSLSEEGIGSSLNLQQRVISSGM